MTPDAKLLTKALIGFTPKRANAFTDLTEQPTGNTRLQEIAGDPDTHPLSWSAQFKPSEGDFLPRDENSPLDGDEVFFSGLMDGARFSDKNGEWWDVDSYDGEGQVTVRKTWYPRVFGIISIQKLRSVIHSWIQPFLQRVPDAPIGANYGVLDVNVTNK